MRKGFGFPAFSWDGIPMECPSCGMALPESAKFCAHCGWRVAGDLIEQAAHNIVKVGEEAFRAGAKIADRAVKAVEPAAKKTAQVTRQAVGKGVEVTKKAVKASAEAVEKTARKVRERAK